LRDQHFIVRFQVQNNLINSNRGHTYSKLDYVFFKLMALVKDEDGGGKGFAVRLVIPAKMTSVGQAGGKKPPENPA
jgi:hypothetical protein